MYQFLFENVNFSLRIAFPSLHTYPVNTVTENGTFQKHSPEWKVLKTPFSYARVDGCKQNLDVDERII